MHPPIISIVIRGSKKPIKHSKLELHITYIVRIVLCGSLGGDCYWLWLQPNLGDNGGQ